MKKHHKNQHGFSHHFILPVLAFVAVGAIGAYVIAKSNAATAGPSDVVYSTQLKAGGDKYYRYSSASGTSTQYSLKYIEEEILDVSQDQQWVLVRSSHTYAAVSKSGEKLVYGNFQYVNDMGDSCTKDGTFLRDILFSKVTSSTAPKVYVSLVQAPCKNGSYIRKSATTRVYSMGVNGANKKALTKAFSGDGIDTGLFETSTNGNFLFRANGYKYIVSSAGKTLFKINDFNDLYLSENGKKITYERSFPNDITKLYIADANGKNTKKVYSTTSTIILDGISPTGSYVVYKKALSKDFKKQGLYTLDTKTKKSKLIDTAYSSDNSIGASSPIDQQYWLPGSNTLVYVIKIDPTAKTTQLIQISASGANKKTIASYPYSTVDWIKVF